MGEKTSAEKRNDFRRFRIRKNLRKRNFVKVMGVKIGGDKTSETKVTNKTIVVFMVFVREFVLAFGFLMYAFFFRKFCGNVLQRMHALKAKRKYDG